MTTATIEELTQRVQIALAESKLRDSVRSVKVEPAFADADWEVLRIYLPLKDERRIDVPEASRLIKAIVNALQEIDDRFPSVRFAEAA